ncbi:MAG: thioredoxin-like domain-containing protein [Bacteroidales bacterium]|nr:thioredoxin-like domain-containing protein [Bacteroidales bacterium]
MLKMSKTVILSIVILWLHLFPQLASAQKPEYKITIHLEGINDTVCYLAFYMGDKIYVKDTAKVYKGAMVFYSDTSVLKPGMYIVAGQASNKYMEFLVNKNSRFALFTKKEDIAGAMKVKNSPENQKFYAYIAYLQKQQEILTPFRKILESGAAGSDSVARAKEQIKIINQQVEAHRKTLLNENEGTLFAAIIKATQPPEIPEIPPLPDGKPDSIGKWNAYRQHYWDNFDLADERLLRTPEFHKKIEHWFDHLVYPHPDSIAAAIDVVIEKAKPAEETYKYLIWYLTLKYERSTIMGYDAVFVHMAKTYYKSGTDTWSNPTVVKNIIERAAILEPLLIGKKAPELLLWDTAMQIKSLYNTKARYTIVYFWDSDCGHCKKEIPLLKAFYSKYKEQYNLEVFGVYADTSFTAMKKYIRNNALNWINVNGYYSASGDFHDLYDIYSTPVMYLLDEEKTILAKRVLTHDIQMLLERLEAKQAGEENKETL